MKAVIKEKKEIAKGTLLVTYDLLGKNIDFKSGQYFYITLLNPPYHDNLGAQRHFSIVNSPGEKGIIKMATRVRESAFKRSLVEMAVGSEVEIGSVSGKFTLPEKLPSSLVFLAGGIGITPFMSMLGTLDGQMPKVTLLYSNRDKESTAFFEELAKLAKNNLSFKPVMTMTEDPSWQGEKRRIDAVFIKDYVPDFNSALFYVAGATRFVEEIEKILSSLGVRKENKITENFLGY